MANKPSIARNTAYLYVRMLVVLLVTLYTSRVILQVLGINDFGLYQTVGGVVGFLAFISNALATATSRFITFSLGKGNQTELERTFSTTLMTHVLIGLLIVLLAETLGLWYVHNKMVIPDDRYDASLLVFHLSIITAFITILQVPFNAEVIAHERMSVFAYVGVVEAVCKLGIIYLLSLGDLDKLVLYALLLCIIQISIFLFYVIYCKRIFMEVSFKHTFDVKLFKNIFGFSSWSLFANGSIALSNQGILLLLNLFFAPAVVTARTISLQVNNAATLFVQNFRTAANPQIVKRYASGDYQGSKNLLLDSTKYSYFLMLLIAMPLFFLADPLLRIWLIEVPDYTVVFLQIVIIQSLFQVFDTSFYTALYAIGRIRENAILSPLTGFICFPIVYALFKLGYSPIALSWAYLVVYMVLGMVVKPILIVKLANYGWREIIDVFKSCVVVTIAAIPLPLFAYTKFGVDSIESGLLVLIASVISVIIPVWSLGLSESIKNRILVTARLRKQ